MKTVNVRYLAGQYTVIVDDEDQIEDLKLYINNVSGSLKVMYRNDDGFQSRLDRKLRGYSCSHLNDNSLDLRAENCKPIDRAAIYRARPVTCGETGVKGISRRKSDGKFVATYCIKSKTKFIGAYDTIPEAEAARTLKLKELGIA